MIRYPVPVDHEIDSEFYAEDGQDPICPEDASAIALSRLVHEVAQLPVGSRGLDYDVEVDQLIHLARKLDARL